MPSSPGGAQITPLHEQILKTALLPSDQTKDEWAKVVRRAEDLWAPDTRQLLPLLSRALVDARIDDPIVPELMQTARRAWVDNQLTFERLGAARPTRRERHTYRRAARELVVRRHWLSGEAAHLSTSWARVSINYSRSGALSSIGPFLRGRAHVDHIWTLPFVVTRRRIRGLGDQALPTPR